MFIESNQSAQTRSLRSDCHPARRNIGDRRGPRSVLGRDDKGIREKRRANMAKSGISHLSPSRLTYVTAFLFRLRYKESRKLGPSRRHAGRPGSSL